MSIQYFFYKKTGEVVFDKTIVTRRQLEKSNKVVETLYGSNQGKTYITSLNQLTPITSTTSLNIWEKSQLKNAHLSKNCNRWNEVVSYIKKVRNNQYPPKWNDFLLSDYGTINVFNEPDKTNCCDNETSSDSNDISSSESMKDTNTNNLQNLLPNLFDKNFPLIPSNIKLISFSLSNDNNTFIKPNEVNNNNCNKNEIRFEFQEHGGILIKVVDFLTRIRWRLLLNKDQIIKLPLGSVIYFDKPFCNEILLQNEYNITKKELLEKVIEWTKEQIEIYNNKSENKQSIQVIDNFGLEKIEIINNDKKQINHRFEIKYLYE